MRSFFKLFQFAVVFGFVLSFVSCGDNELEAEEPMLIIKFNFDNSHSGMKDSPIAIVAPDNGAISPNIASVSASYMELARDRFSQLGDESVIYKAPETDIGGENAIDFGKSKVVSDGETFLKIPLRQIATGSYNWFNVALSYQNYEIPVLHAGNEYEATLASFVGVNTYIGSYSIGNNFFDIHKNRAQGYWAFSVADYPYSVQGQLPEKITTIPNPLTVNSPIPLGSSVVKGKFSRPLVITGKETKDVSITLSLSAKNSFQWREIKIDGKFEPSIGEQITSLEIKGLAPSFK